jgi:hypothetical protein
MLSLIPSCRYLMLAIVILSNAIICSVSVWNYFIAQAINYNLQVDAYLVFLGAFSLSFIFLTIFTGLIWKNSVTCHVWYESLWVGVFFCLEFAGAVGLSSVVPELLCNASSVVTPLPQSCTSTRVLLAFTWICSITLMGYFLLLVITASLHARIDYRVWHRPVRHFNWPELPDTEESTESSKSSTTGLRSPMSIVAPKPRRIVPAALFAYRRPTSSEYRIDPFFHRPPTVHVIRPPPTAVPPPQMTQQPQNSYWGYQASAFYPVHVQKTLASHPYVTQVPPRTHDIPSTPPPLGDWPRADAVSQPRRQKRQPAPPPLSPPEVLYSSGPISAPYNVETPALPPPVALVSPRSRPSGPRSRSRSQTGDWTRPPPLDLSKVSSFGERTTRR